VSVCAVLYAEHEKCKVMFMSLHHILLAYLTELCTVHPYHTEQVELSSTVAIS